MTCDRPFHDQVPALLQAMDAGGRLTAVTDRWLAWLGYERSQVIGQPWREFLTAAGRSQLAAGAADDGPLNLREAARVPFQTVQGTVVEGQVAISCWESEPGEPTTYVMSLSECTPPSQAAHAAEERFQLITETIQDVFWINDVQTRRVIYNSPNFEALWELPIAAIADDVTVLLMRVHADDRATFAQYLTDLFTSPQPSEFEYRIQLPSGQIKWLSQRSFPVLDAAGQPVQVVGMTRDISDRKQAELDLQASQQLLQMVFDHLPQRIFWKDYQGRFLGCNQVFAQDMGVSHPSQVIGKTDHDFGVFSPESVDLFLERDRQIMSLGETITFDESVQSYADGRQRWVATTKAPFITPQGALVGIFCCYEDVTERVSAKRSLQRYAHMVEAATDAICLLDTDYRYQLINQTYRQWYGPDERQIIGQTVAEVLGQEIFAALIQPLLDQC